MPTDLPKRDRSRKHVFPLSPSNGHEWTAASFGVPAVLLVLTMALPLPLVLPAFGIVAVAAGLVVGIYGCISRSQGSAAREQTRDAAAVLILIGFGASMMTDAGSALAAFAEIESYYSGTSPRGT